MAPLNGQITNDFDWWLNNLPGYDELHRDKAEIFGTNDKEKIAPIAEKISAINLASADDPPTYMSYRMKPGDPIPEGDQATGWKVHHVTFGITLKKEARCPGGRELPQLSKRRFKVQFGSGVFHRQIWQIMTSDQIAEAQKMAREMVEANTKLMGE